MKCVFAILIQVFVWIPMAHGIEADLANPQGAIWRTQEYGHSEAAQALEIEIQHVLETAPLESLARHGGGVSVSYIARFEKNIFAIVKEGDPALPESYRHERAAYLVDKALGLHMVPLTVVREHQGKIYSLQLYYPSFPSDGVIDLMESEFYLRRADVAVFDYLISNIDRNLWEGSNVLLGKEGRMIIFDHARSFFSGPPVAEVGDLGEVHMSLRNRILSISESELRKILKDLVSVEAQNDLIERLLKLKVELERLPQKSLPEMVRREAPLVPDVFEVPEKVEGLRFENILSRNRMKSCSRFFEFRK